MQTRRRGVPWRALLLCVVMVLASLPLYSQVAHADVNLALGLTGYSNSTNAGCFSDSGSDTGQDQHCINDGVRGAAGGSWFPGGSYQCTGTCWFASGYSSFSGGAVIYRVAAEFKYHHYGHWEVVCGGNAEGVGGTIVYTSSDYPAAYTYTGIVTLSETCDLAVNRIFVVNVGDIGSGQSWGVNEVELYGSAISTVDISVYMYNMQVGHPSFAWTAGWGWATTWTGTLDITTSPSGQVKAWDDRYVAHSGSVSFTPLGGYVGGPVLGEYVVQDCYPLCASDSFTVTITDTGRSQTASYTFLRSASGYVSSPLSRPYFRSWSICYNATTGQCGNGSASGKVDIAYTWEGSHSNVQYGPTGLVNSSLYYNASPWPYLQANQAAGSYTYFGLTPPDTGAHRTYLLAATNNAGQDRKIVSLDFSAGGAVTGTAPSRGGDITQPTQPGCGDINPVCGLQQLFDIVASDVVDAVRGALNGLRDLALTRQPFNFIVRSFDGVTVQLARAQAAVTSTSTCTGYVMTVPMPSPYWPTAAPLPSFAVLKCSDLEPAMGSSWWQTIRAAMTPAIYLFWGYAELRRITPRPVVAG